MTTTDKSWKVESTPAGLWIIEHAGAMRTGPFASLEHARTWFEHELNIVNGKHVRYRLPGFTTSEKLADCDTEANARLIAAAPEMLEALKLVESIVVSALAFVDCNPQLRLLRAAIAKAEGERLT